MKTLEELFEEEKAWLREAGAEFAAANPRLTTFLGGANAEAADPHVDRILEAVAFFAARLERRFDQSLMRLAQEILDVCYPALFAPQPALCLARYEPGPTMGPLRFVPAGVRMVNEPTSPGTSPVQLVATEPCTVSWLVPTGVDPPQEAGLGVASLLKLRVGRADGQPISKEAWPRTYSLTPFWNNFAYSCAFFAALRGMRRAPEVRVDRGSGDIRPLRPGPVVKVKVPSEFGPLLEEEPDQFPGLRILKEFLALPHRFMQLEITGLDSCSDLDGAVGLEVEFLLPLPPGDLPPIGAANFVPNVVGVANRWLGEARAVNYDGTLTQYDLVLDRRLGGEILRVAEVRAIRPGQRDSQSVPRFDYFDRSRLAYAARSDVSCAAVGEGSASARWLIEIHEGEGDPGPPFRLLSEIIGCDREAHRALENATRLTNHEGLPQDVRCALLGTPSRYVPALVDESEYWALITALSAGIQQLSDARSLRRLLGRLNRTEDRLAADAIASIQQVKIEQRFTTIRQEPRKVHRVTIRVAAGRSVAAYWAPFYDVLHDFLRSRLTLNAELELRVLDASGDMVAPPRGAGTGVGA